MVIHIEVYNQNRSYFAGENIHGRVIIQNEKPDKVKQVTILLQGRGHVEWDEYGSGMGILRVAPAPQIAQETYVTFLSVLAGDGEHLTILPEGTTIYPFHFLLPSSLPSSFHSQIGQVSYFLKVDVTKSSTFKIDSSAKLYFTVNGIFDLNLQPGATVARKCTQVMSCNFYARRRGKLNFVLSLPTRSGFVPGEAIHFKADIENGSNKKITGVRASLQQVENFYADGLTKTKKRQVCEVQGPEVDKGEHRIWEGNLLIPAIPPTKLGSNCKIIELEYFLYLEVNVSGVSGSRTARLPVMIGTIPLRSTFADFNSIPQRVSSSVNTMPSTPTDGFPGNAINPSINLEVAEQAPVYYDYPDLPPPSYAEAVGSEGSSWTPEDYNNDAYENGFENLRMGHDEARNISTASSPTIDEFVPNYITYCRKV